MKILLLISLLLPLSVQAEVLQNPEVKCWHESVDDGAFYCVFLLVLGNRGSNGESVVSEIAAPDEGGEKTLDQAQRACRALGFRRVARFELAKSRAGDEQVRLHESGAELEAAAPSYIEHVSCE